MKFFSHVGFPREVQTDQGSNFTSKLFRNVLKGLEVEPQFSTAYHPPSQGEIEKLYQTLKTIMQAYGINNTNNWDERIPSFVFAEWGSTLESLSYWLGEDGVAFPSELFLGFRCCLARMRWMVPVNVPINQTRMMMWDHNALEAVEEVLILEPIHVKICMLLKTRGTHGVSLDDILTLMVYVASLGGPDVFTHKDEYALTNRLSHAIVEDKKLLSDVLLQLAFL
ncbi:uncharacterized protein [Cherax quadricarinatus]|uniref:uncharacterized protein isoform X1 n=1 Tax=Cherax quadricarinatus TaxID=27406 RepID=UPI00387E77FC